MNWNSKNLIEQLANFYLMLRALADAGNDIGKSPSIFILILSASLMPAKLFAAAGDLITNTVTINYEIDGVPGVGNATTSFTEDRRINFFVSEFNGSAAVPVVSDMNNAVMQFTVTNTGNDLQDFLLTAVNTAPSPFALPADNYDPLAGTIRVFVESGGTPGYQPAQDTAVYIDELNINATQTVYVVADMPVIATGDVAAIALIAQVAEGGAPGSEGAAVNADDNGRISPAGTFSNGATTVSAGIPAVNADTLGMETVFNDPAGNSIEDISSALGQDTAGNGQHTDAGAYQSTSPVILSKSVTVIDTLGGNEPHPGATLRYQLDVTIAGNTPVDGLIINDPVPANTTYTDGSIVLNGITQTDTDDTPTDYSRAIDILSKPVASIEVDLSQGGTVSQAPGSINTIIFEVTID